MFNFFTHLNVLFNSHGFDDIKITISSSDQIKVLLAWCKNTTRFFIEEYHQIADGPDGNTWELHDKIDVVTLSHKEQNLYDDDFKKIYDAAQKKEPLKVKELENRVYTKMQEDYMYGVLDNLSTTLISQDFIRKIETAPTKNVLATELKRCKLFCSQYKCIPHLKSIIVALESEVRYYQSKIIKQLK